jgi:hypothetical protein
MHLKHIFLLVALGLVLFNCDKEPQKQGSIKEDSSETTLDSINSEIGMEEFTDNTQLNYIVSLKDGYNYDSLRTLAVNVSKEIGFTFDTMGRYYDPKRGIILPDHTDDEMWAGQYLLRRGGDSAVSVERTSYYLDVKYKGDDKFIEKFDSDTSRMFVFVTMFPEKSDAEKIAKILLKKYPDTKIVESEIFIGCMH